MQRIIINGEEYIVEKYEETGDFLMIRRIVHAVDQKAFLLTGNSLVKTDYYLPLQVFSFLKKQNLDFLLFILVPDWLKVPLACYSDSLGLSDRICMIEDCTISDESIYKEIIDITRLFDTGLILRKTGKVIGRSFSALAENLESIFGGKQDESR